MSNRFKIKIYIIKNKTKYYFKRYLDVETRKAFKIFALSLKSSWANPKLYI